MKNIEKTITLYCGICGSSDFKIDSEKSLYTCAQCDEVYTKAEVINDNKYIIDQHVDEMKKELMNDIEDKFKKMMKGFK